MSIYKLEYKDLRKYMTKFMKTIYGKITFTLAYSIPIILTSILLVFTFFLNDINTYAIVLFIYTVLFLILVSFICGTVYYYHELKEFIKEQK